MADNCCCDSACSVQGDNDRLQDLCDALDDFLNFTGRWDERLLLNLQAEEKALAAKDMDNAGWRAYQRAGYTILRGQVPRCWPAPTASEQHWAKAVCTRTGVCHSVARPRIRIGEGLSGGDCGLSRMRSRCGTYCVSPESEDVAIGLNDLAGAERLSGDYAAAERDYREALRIAKKVNYREGVAITGQPGRARAGSRAVGGGGAVGAGGTVAE